ncbi:hypothetical protein CBS101457_003114 [Exobasidium rhododendri]|nr:hypothetical protein CBS101457_003114 [Exobasidium rhododendri]
MTISSYPTSDNFRKESVASSSALSIPSTTQRMRSLIKHPYFLRQAVAIYIEECDVFYHLLSGSRLHRLTIEQEETGEDFSGLWDELENFALATLALVALLCPASVEATLVTLDAASRQGFEGAAEIAETAYHITCASIATDLVQTNHKSCQAELFASLLLIRKYEKSIGLTMPFIDGTLVDIARMQRNGYHQYHFHNGAVNEALDEQLSAIRWRKEHDLLLYRSFCLYFGADRMISLYTGSGYMLQGRHINICLNDYFGHVPFSELCSVDSEQSTSPECFSCGVTPGHHSGDLFGPALTPFEGASVRIAALAGRYLDKLASVRSPRFQWPVDAEKIATELDSDLQSFERMISTSTAQHANLLCPAQQGVLILSVAHLKRAIAQQLYGAFGTRLVRHDVNSNVFGSAPMRVDEKTVQWLLNRRKLDAAKELIERVIGSPRQLVVGHPNWVFVPKFIHGQAKDLLDSAMYWHRYSSSRGVQKNGAMCSTSQSQATISRGNLLTCVHYSLLARNFLVVFARRSTLSEVQRLTTDICHGCSKLLHRILQRNLNLVKVAESTHTVDEAYLVSLVAEQIDHAVSTDAEIAYLQDPSTQASLSQSDGGCLDIDEALADFFIDLPTLERMFLTLDGGTDWENSAAP